MIVKIYSVIVVLFCSGYTVVGQNNKVEYPGRPRYPDGMLGISIGGGATKYLGEFSDERIGYQGEIEGQYSIVPEVAVGVHYAYGTAKYRRRMRFPTGAEYLYQFGDSIALVRTTTYNTFQIHLKINLFPRQNFNAYVFGGAGIVMYQPQDYAQNRVKLRAQKEKYVSFTIPVGFGLEYFLRHSLALYSSLTMQFLYVDDFDAFASGDIRDEYLRETAIAVNEGNDGFITWNFGMRYFLFKNNDLDGDLLTNQEEEKFGTNPHDADTDGDRLSDYEEVKIYQTDPLIIDTDDDGFTDYQEIIWYHTDPLKEGTDGDGLTDYEELMIYHTNPLVDDTDSDGLTDYEEVRIYLTNPNKIDTDGDGLSDYDEVKKYRTDPLNVDTDGDKLSDKEEISIGTYPRKVDTDRDGLTDYEEVNIYFTNPLEVDTDGDQLSDYVEVKLLGTNPLKRDTDSDGVPDNLDKCPTVFGSIKNNGCPDEESKRIVSRQSTIRIDTVVIREGATVTLFSVNFENDKAVIRPESIPILEMNAQLFQKYPELVVEIRGHTDLRGDFEHNMGLSLRRAQSVEKYLLSMGIKSERIAAKGFGPTKPVATNNTAIGRARNRRIEFYILKVGNTADSLKFIKPK